MAMGVHSACTRSNGLNGLTEAMPASWLPGSDNACCVTFRPSQTAGLQIGRGCAFSLHEPRNSPGPCCGRDCLRLRSDSLLDRGPIRCALFTADVGWPRLSLNELGHDSVRHHVTRPRPPGLGRSAPTPQATYIGNSCDRRRHRLWRSYGSGVIVVTALFS